MTEGFVIKMTSEKRESLYNQYRADGFNPSDQFSSIVDIELTERMDINTEFIKVPVFLVTYINNAHPLGVTTTVYRYASEWKTLYNWFISRMRQHKLEELGV